MDRANASALQKQALSDEQFQLNVGDANDNITGFRKQLALTTPHTKDWEEASLGLKNAIQARTQLFDPSKNPTAMQKFGHMLLDHVPGYHAAPPPVQPGPPTISATPAMQLQAAPQKMAAPSWAAPSAPPRTGTGQLSTSYQTGPLAGQLIPGMLQRGNIDVNHRPGIKNDDGSSSSIFSMTVPVGKDGSPQAWGSPGVTGYALVPSIANGKFLTANGKMPDKSGMSQLEDAATAYYGQTRQHLGTFKSAEEANAYAGKTHAYTNDGSANAVYAPSYDADQNGDPMAAANPTPLDMPGDSLSLPQGQYGTVQGPQTRQQLMAQAQANLMAASGPRPLPRLLTPDEERQAARIHAKLEPGATADKPDRWQRNGAPFPNADGTWSEPQIDAEGNHRNQLMAAGYAPPPPKAAPESNSEFRTLLRAMNPGVPNGSYTEDMVTAAIVKKKEMETPSGTGWRDMVVTDLDGTPHIERMFFASEKKFPHAPSSAADGSPAAPTQTVRPAGGGGSPAGGGAKPSGGRVLPYKKITPAYTKAVEARDLANTSYESVKSAVDNFNPVTSQGIVMSWLRGRVGRISDFEIQLVNNVGGATMKLEGGLARIVSGTMSEKQAQMFLESARGELEATQKTVDTYKTSTPGDLRDKAKANTPADAAKDPLGVL